MLFVPEERRYFLHEYKAVEMTLNCLLHPTKQDVGYITFHDENFVGCTAHCYRFGELQLWTLLFPVKYVISPAMKTKVGIIILYIFTQKVEALQGYRSSWPGPGHRPGCSNSERQRGWQIRQTAG